MLPAANQIVLVTTRLSDPDGVTNAFLKYRLDPSSTYTSVAMLDNGTGGDVVAGDGLYSVSIPGQASGTLVTFYIEVADRFASPATNRFPKEAPTRECLVRFGEVQPSGSFGAYRFWLTQTNTSRWKTREKLNSEPLDATFAYGNERAVYNINAMYSGSSFTVTYYTGPTGALCGYSLDFPSDDRFLGATDMLLNWPVRDQTAQREQVAYWMANALGLRSNYRRFVNLFVNGVSMASRGNSPAEAAKVYEDAQKPNGDLIEEYFPGNDNGNLYKFDNWDEFDAAGTNQLSIGAASNPTMGLYLTTNYATQAVEKKRARYRTYYEERAVQGAGDNLTNLLALVDALNTTNTGNAYTTIITNLIEIDQWMRTLALEDVADNADSFGNGNGKNMYAYKPLGEKWQLLLWDLDFGLGETASCEPELTSQQPLFYGYDTVVSNLNAHPPFRRMYWRGIQDAVNGPMLSANVNPIIDMNYAALLANSITAQDTNNAPIAVQNPDFVGLYSCTTNYTLKSWISGRRTALTNELAKLETPFEISNNGGNNFAVTNQSSISLVGKAPVQVAFIRLNNASTNAAVTWTSVTNWSLGVSLSTGANTNTVQGYDRLTNAISGASDSITITNQP